MASSSSYNTASGTKRNYVADGSIIENATLNNVTMSGNTYTGAVTGSGDGGTVTIQGADSTASDGGSANLTGGNGSGSGDGGDVALTTGVAGDSGSSGDLVINIGGSATGATQYTWPAASPVLGQVLTVTSVSGSDPTVVTTAWATPPTRGGLIIPLYVYPVPAEDADPANEYNIIQAVDPDIPLYVIINPNNGDDATSAPNTDWVWGVGKLTAKNTLGYIYTSYGARAIGDIQAVIDGYIDNGWGVEGFFFDEVSSNTNVAFYQSIVDYIRAKPSGDSYTIVFNPGVGSIEAIGFMPDICVNFESPAATYDAYTPPVYQDDTNPHRWAGMVLSVALEADAVSYLGSLKNDKFYWKYILEDSDFSHLPAYLDAMLEWVKQGP
jgi:hypothetical protein